MDTRLHQDYQPLCKIAAGLISGTFAGSLQDVPVYNQNVYDGLGTGTDPVRPAFVNELVLFFAKTQGSADEIWIQVQESDDEFVTPILVPIMGREYHVITAAMYTDGVNYRLPIALQIRGKSVRVLAKYSGGAATLAAIDVRGKMCPTNQFSHQGAVTVIGASGTVADVKNTDIVVGKGLAYSAAIAVSAGTWLSDVVTFTQATHGYDIGATIVVSGCGNASYDGSYTVVSVPTGNTWTAALTPNPGAFTTAGSGLQAQSTTLLVDETKAWTADEHATNDRYVEITSGTGNKQYAAITDNGTQWLAFAAMATAPVTSDSMYKIVELDVPGLVVNTELDVKIGSIAVNSIENYKYIAAPPDLAGGETCMGRADVKGNVQVVGPEAHSAAIARNPVLMGGYASDVAQTVVTAADISRLWVSLNGATVIAGLYDHATPANAVAHTLPIVIDDAIMVTGATAIPGAGQYNATPLTYTDKDACVFQMTISGELITTGGVGESDLNHGQNTVAAAGTEEALGGDVAILAGQRVLIKALHGNTGAIYVGDSVVDSTDGFVLFPGESVSLAVTNLNIPYIDADNSGEGVSYIVEVS